MKSVSGLMTATLMSSSALSVADLVDRLEKEYLQARQRLLSA